MAGRVRCLDLPNRNIQRFPPTRHHGRLADVGRRSSGQFPLIPNDAGKACASATHERRTGWPPQRAAAGEKYEASLDDTIAISIPKPKNKEEEDKLVVGFFSGLEKLFTKENDWTFLQPLLLSMDHCVTCHTCSDACHIYEASGRNPIYRPAYRSEVFRRLYKKCVKSKRGLLPAWRDGEIELNWTTVARLAELAYRCNLCRRCAQKKYALLELQRPIARPDRLLRPLGEAFHHVRRPCRTDRQLHDRCQTRFHRVGDALVSRYVTPNSNDWARSEARSAAGLCSVQTFGAE